MNQLVIVSLTAYFILLTKHLAFTWQDPEQVSPEDGV